MNVSALFPYRCHCCYRSNRIAILNATCSQYKKPIILSHHMLMGLKQGQAKMSKSDPDSAIFMEDSVEDVNRKIKKGKWACTVLAPADPCLSLSLSRSTYAAYCPPMIVEDNPCLDYVQHLIFPKYGSFDVKRPEKYGGDKLYRSFDEVRNGRGEGLSHRLMLTTIWRRSWPITSAIS